MAEGVASAKRCDLVLTFAGQRGLISKRSGAGRHACWV